MFLAHYHHMLKSLAVISCCYMYELMLKPMGLPNGPAYTPAGLCSQPSCSHGPSSHFRTVQEQSGRTSDVAERNRGRKSRAAANRRGHAIFHRPLPEEEKKRPRAIQVILCCFFFPSLLHHLSGLDCSVYSRGSCLLSSWVGVKSRVGISISHHPQVIDLLLFRRKIIAFVFC